MLSMREPKQFSANTAFSSLIEKIKDNQLMKFIKQPIKQKLMGFT
ncbi:hypothetical protein [Alkalihalobacillus pseudalcaliphilus]|nr:hypothetical protein [Alkalihalobacillus pseudalcaliphilus]